VGQVFSFGIALNAFPCYGFLKEREKKNSQYLADANALGSRFVIVTEKIVETVSWLWKELQYLIEHGIPREMP